MTDEKLNGSFQDESKKSEPVVSEKRSQRKRPKEEQSDKPVKWVRLRLLPIWLRVLIVLLLLCLAAAAGVMIGYSVLGDGQASEVFKKETWTHILDILSGKES